MKITVNVKNYHDPEYCQLFDECDDTAHAREILNRFSEFYAYPFYLTVDIDFNYEEKTND